MTSGSLSSSWSRYGCNAAGVWICACVMVGAAGTGMEAEGAAGIDDAACEDGDGGVGDVVLEPGRAGS